jgi:hypothetical protein
VQGIGPVRIYGQVPKAQQLAIQVIGKVNINIMKEVMKKAAKYESKKSLEGPMKFLKGNVAKAKKEVMPKKKK